MAIVLQQVSALEKIRISDSLNFKETHSRTAMQGERVSYQIAIKDDNARFTAKVSVESELKDAVKLYRVKEVYADRPATENIEGENYIITEPGYLPDVLVPIEDNGNMLTLTEQTATIWVKVNVPKDQAPGKYTVKVTFDEMHFGAPNTVLRSATAEMEIDVIPAVMPEQKLIYTRWFYADCIADHHNVSVYSEEHWALIEKYISAAAEVGINMILVPIHTPPLDTEVGTARTCVQLVDIEKKGETYEFGFDKFKRFISICKKCGIKYYEMAHLFSQWGAECAPNIMVTENGKTDYMFGWHVAASSPEYTAFLKQYIKAIATELDKEGISENTYFHVSDEPNTDNIEKYATARNIIKPLIGNSKTFDALSHYEFCEQGLVECPVTSVSVIHSFLPHKIENQWVYYCCGPQRTFTNSFIAMPSARVRVLGYQIYKYDIKGFLHWGFNFYNAVRSRYHIDPYLTTSADGVFPSGDGFIVYPAKDGAYGSIRGEVTYQAIEDMNICFALEEIIGRDAVVAMIDEAAGGELRFDSYPCDNGFTENLRAKMIEEIQKAAK
ncbi:MAG: DUF4091 domain-containing protein [Clostridia bacterium]|nr:DUF4091 domain-containing protein [Clostridia bacterium]